MHSKINDMGSYFKVEYGNMLLTEITAGLTTLDAVEYESSSIDRDGFGSAKILVPYSATLDTDETFKATVSIADSTDDSDWNAYAAVLDSIAVVTGTTAGTTTGVREIDVDLSSYSRYIKIKYKPDLSASSTDTLSRTGTLVALGGATELPVS
jgi:hypothetical protein